MASIAELSDRDNSSLDASIVGRGRESNEGEPRPSASLRR
jgi:hypothetical protein